MDENKEFYWIKLKIDFFDIPAIDWLEEQQNGYAYIVLYQKLCLLTANTGGELTRKIGEMIIPYDAKKIAEITKFDIDTVVVALELYRKLGLIYLQSDGVMRIDGVSDMTGSETKWAGKKRLQREKKKAIEAPGEDIVLIQSGHSEDIVPNLSPKSEDIVRQEYRDKSIEIRDKRLDIRDKSLDIENRERLLAQTAAEQRPVQEPIITLTLNDKSEYPIFEKSLTEWEELYPAVDVMQQLRAMKGWLNANPTKRKTKSGILRFINSWLSKEQDSGRVTRIQATKQQTTGVSFMDMLRQEGAL